MFMVAAKFMETKERESKGFQKIENTSFWFNVKLGITDVMRANYCLFKKIAILFIIYCTYYGYIFK
jgi:hypothetical protein